jgi:FKBP-type peptidyl-prolyl cis-trans isomerase FklB
MRQIFFIFLVVIWLAPLCWAEEQIPLKEQKARDSYSLGYDFGNNLKRQGVDVNPDVLLSAVREGLEGKKPALSPEEIRDTLLQLRKKLMVLQDRRYRELSTKNLEEGRAFLEANKTKEGIHTLPSGLQYKVLREGEGPIPKATDTVTINYRGTLIDGKEFDSSYVRGKPLTAHVFGVIDGWTEALQLMKVGSKWQLFIPPDLAYGDRQYNRIQPNSTLIFEIELLSIGDRSDSEATEMPAAEEPASNLPHEDNNPNTSSGQ